MKKEKIYWFMILLLGLGGMAQAQNVIEISDTQTWDTFADGGFADGDTLKILAGGNLTINSRTGVTEGRHLIIEEGGIFTTNARLDTDSEGKITMNGGEFHSTVDFKFPDSSGDQQVEIWLYGGLMVCSQIEAYANRGATLYVGGGILRTGATQNEGRDPSDPERWAIQPIPPYPNIVITDIGGGWKEVSAVSPFFAREPDPAHDASDVVRDTILTWMPSFAGTKRDVYFGTDLAAVSNADRGNPLDVLAQEGQVTTTYAPGVLEYGQTYYWRIDEVNEAHPDSPWKGEVWRFTAEPYSYPIETVTATASSSLNADYEPEKTVDGSGLNNRGEHSATMTDMWVSDVESNDPWIQYVFDDTYKLDQMQVWNFNAAFEAALGWGLKDVSLEHTDNGTDWSVLGDVQLAQGISEDGYAANTFIDLDGLLAQGVKLNARNNWGDLISLYGLSEVQILRIVGHAREPQPEDGADDVDPGAILAWRAGREAAQHRVSLGDSRDSLVLVDTVNTNHFDLTGLDLKLGQTYYWKIDEVNDAEIPDVWEGGIWSFSTPTYLVVDDFELYDDECNRIFFVWEDGFGHNGAEECGVGPYGGNGSGSIVGNAVAPFAEQTIVRNGDQSMPFEYDNTSGGNSETVRTFVEPQDWTRAGIQALVLNFYGDSANTGGRLYVKINGDRIDYEGDAGSLTQVIWTQWTIDLGAVNTNLQNVETLTIGVEGAGSSGLLYIDDIQLYEEAPASASELVWIEAEAADTMTIPFEVRDDTTASGGLYIGTLDGIGNSNASPPEEQGIASYTFTVKGGTYKIQIRFLGDDGNSLWIRLADAALNTDIHGSGWILSDLSSEDDWVWDDVTSRHGAGDTVHFTMEPGTYTLDIAYREDGGLIDAIVITDKLD